MNKINLWAWSLVIVICLGFGIWGLGFGIGGCASSQPQLIETSSTSTTTSTQTTTSNTNPPTSTSSTTSTSTSTSSTTTATIAYGDNWVQLGGPIGPVGSGLFFDFDIKISKGGTIYVAYSDSGTGQLTVKKYSGGDWVPVGGPVSPAAAYFYLSIADDGTPYIGCNSALYKYNGSSWVTAATCNVSADGLIHLIAAGDGTPYLAFSDKADGYKAKVLKYNGSSWINLDGPGGNASDGGGIGGIDLFLYGNIPYIAYPGPYSGGPSTVKKYETGSWETVGPAGPGNKLFVSNNIPYLFYISGVAASYESSSDSWITLGTEEGRSFFVDNGTPYATHLDVTQGIVGLDLFLKKYSNGSWNEVPPGVKITGQVSDASLAVFNGVPYIAYSRYKLDVYPFTYTVYIVKYTGP